MIQIYRDPIQIHDGLIFLRRTSIANANHFTAIHRYEVQVWSTLYSIEKILKGLSVQILALKCMRLCIIHFLD